MSATEERVAALALRVRNACIRLHGDTQGHCREASIILAELLLEANVSPCIMVCQGTYGESGHFWVRIGIAGQSWVVDPTVHQFEPAAPLLLREQAAAQYKEASYLLFSQKRLADLRQQVTG